MILINVVVVFVVLLLTTMFNIELNFRQRCICKRGEVCT